jgi:hypothetical protein
MQHERIGVRAQLGDDERRLVSHQAADEMDVAAKPVELGDNDRGLVPLRQLERLWCGSRHTSSKRVTDWASAQRSR